VDGGKDATTGALYTVTHLDEAPSLEEANRKLHHTGRGEHV